jgi:hypothetical protein
MRGPSAVKNFHRTLIIGCSTLALSACGPQDIASPGAGNVTINTDNSTVINNPPPAPTPTPTPTVSLVTPASGCPTIADPQGLTDSGTITGPTGEWRVCTLPRTLMVSSSLPKIAGLLYRLGGRVDVGCDGGFSAPSAYTSTTIGCTTPLNADTNVTLTLAPGSIVFGGTGISWLAVNRGNKLMAVGTSTAPIVFTSRDNVLGLNTESSSGQWGGVVLLGRAHVTDCNYGTPDTSDGSTTFAACERDTEGATDKAIFGGADNAYNAGKMDFVQIRYSGYVLSADKELQSLTTEGIGTGTTLDHFMSFNSSDDGAEFFGGVVNLKHFISIGAEDDNFDVDTGAQFKAQYAIVVQRPGIGDAIFEIDSNGNEKHRPRADIKISNFTALHNVTGNADGAAGMFRGNSDTHLYNGVLVTAGPCIRMHAGSAVVIDQSTFEARSMRMQCGATKYVDSGSFAVGTASAAFGSGSNNNSDSYTPTLTALFINGATETGVPVFNANGVDAFFDTVTYIGAVKDSADTWYAGWTCNSGWADFGSGNSGLCTSLPTT